MRSRIQKWIGRKVDGLENLDEVISYRDLVRTILMAGVGSLIFFFTGWFIPKAGEGILNPFKAIFILISWIMLLAAWRYLLKFVDQFILLNDIWKRSMKILWIAGAVLLSLVMLWKVIRIAGVSI